MLVGSEAKVLIVLVNNLQPRSADRVQEKKHFPADSVPMKRKHCTLVLMRCKASVASACRIVTVHRGSYLAHDNYV